MLGRTAKEIVESTSTDGGRTWSEAKETRGHQATERAVFPAPARFGKILLIKHGDKIDAHEGRVQLSAWLSDDDGKTWTGGLILDERKGVSYPDGFQAPDGTIYISYDRNRATDGEILFANFTEEDIAAKKLVGPKSALKLLICKPLGRRRRNDKSGVCSNLPV